MSYFFYNGLRFAFKRSTSSVAYCAMSIQTGTRNEDPKYSGLAHFTEHLIFKGTEFRGANSINSYIEKLGGELNAFTSKEETVIHATILKEDISKAINLIVELSFRSVFPQNELVKERGVVLDEINSYKDSPSDQIFDDFEEYLFVGSPLSIPVLGRADTLKKIDSKVVTAYYKEKFVPSNMCFTVVADLEEGRVRKMLMRALKKYLPMEQNAIEQENVPQETSHPLLPVNPPFSKEVKKRTHQIHCIIGGQAYSFYQEKRVPLILLVNILGGPAANARLNLLLRERNALVYSVEASYSQYMDSGVMTIYFGCDKGNYEKCLSLIYSELAKFREQPCSETMLKGAKKQLLGQIAISSDNGESQCISMGKGLMVFSEVMEMEQMKAKIEAVTAEDLLEVANEIFVPEKMSKLVYF